MSVAKGYCTGCGECCNPTITSQRISTWPDDDPSKAFCLKNWHEISRKLALEINPFLADAGRVFFHVCDQFDPETRQCMAYEERPWICQGFPWYPLSDGSLRNKPKETGKDNLRPWRKCGYWLDVPKRQWPELVQIETTSVLTGT